MPTLEELQEQYNKSIQKEAYLGKPENTDVNIGFSQPLQEQGVAFSNKDIYGAINENLENRRSRNQGAWETVGIGVGRLAGKTLTKTTETAGFLAGLAGIDNNSEDYGKGLSAWIAGAADNGLATLASDMEQKLENITPLYNSIEDKAANKISVFNNLMDGDFWAGDAVDATAFLLSAYLTGGAVAEAKIGQGLVKGLAKKGLMASNLNKVANATNHLTATALQTASESMFEAKELRDNLREQIAEEKFGSNFDFLSPEQKQQINQEVAPAAAKTFALNMLLLAPSNAIEMGNLMKSSTRLAGKTKGLANKGLQTTLAEGNKLQNFLNTKTGTVLYNQAKNILSEGLYEENAQLAVSEMLKANRDADLFSLSTYGDVLSKMSENFETEEGKKSMLLGSLIGGISGTMGGIKDYNANKKAKDYAVAATGKELANMFSVNNIFETEEYTEEVDGKPVTKTRYKLGDDGAPVIDNNKLQAVLKQKQEFEFLDDIATLAEEKGDDVLYGLAKNNAINRWIKSHFASGSEDLLEDKINYLQRLSDEEYLKQGLNPAEKGQYIANLRNKVAEFTRLSKDIESNLVAIDTSKKGSENFLARKNELYNIGTVLNDVKDEKNRLTLEQAEINSNEQSQTLNAKRLAYIDLKLNELTEAENKYKEEFNKIANINTGQKYFDTDYKKSITQKVNTFDFEKGNLDQFNAFENSKLYKSGLELKAKNIENDFFEQSIQERIENNEEATEIVNDLVADNVPVTKETKDLLLGDLQFKKAALKEIQDYIQEMQYGEEPDPLSDYAQQLSDSFNNDFDAFNEYAAKIEKAIADVENLPLAEKLDTSKKSIKARILEPFTNMVKGIVFTANTNEDYENVSEVENAIKSLENTIKVLEEKKDSDYDSIISEYKNLLEDLKAIQEVVKERVADKQRQQEKIAGQTLELQKDSLNSVPELVTLVSDITGLDISNLDSEIKDLSLWEQIGYLTNVISQVKTQITPEQLQKLKNLEKSLTAQVEALVAANSKSDVLVNAVKKFYSKNPKLIFNDIVQLTIAYSKDRNSAYSKYLKDFNFYNLYEKVMSNDVQFRLPENVTHEIYNLHKQVLGVNNLISIVESEYNPVTEIVTENAVGKEEKIVPSNQQLASIRDLVKFLLTKKDNQPFANFAYLKGFAGTGKTNIVLRWFTKVAALKQEEIFATGHNENSAKAINNSIGSPEVRSLEDLKYRLINNSLGKTKVIIIDEVNALNKNEIVEINELLVKYNQANNTQIKIIGLGDPNQVTATGENPFVSPVYTPGLENATVITPLTIRYRSNVQAVVDAQDLFMDQREDLTKQEIFLTSNPEKTLGAEASLQSDSIEKALATRDLNDGKTRAIIVHPSEVEMWKAKNLGVEVVSYIDVQGRTIDEVFVSIPKTKFGDVFAFNQAMYTATSRATNFIHINGMSSKNITDENVNKITDKNVKAIEESKKNFEDNRIAEMKQVDESIEIKPAKVEIKPEPIEEETEVDLEIEEVPVVEEEQPASTTPVSDIKRIEIPRYFTFGELGGKPGKKAGETIESEKNAEIQENFEKQLKEGDKLIEPNGDVFFYKNGKIVKPNGQPRNFRDIGAFLNGVTIERNAELAALEGKLAATVETPTTAPVSNIERKTQEEKEKIKKQIKDNTDTSEYENIDLSGYFNIGYDMSEEEKNKRLADDIEVFVENNDSITEEDYKNYMKTQGHTLFAWAYRNNPKGLKQGVDLYKKLKQAFAALESKPETKSAEITTVLNLKYPNNKSLKGTTENGKNVPAVKPGETVVYVPFENKQGNKSIGIFVDRNGDYLEVGVLSEEELNNPPANKIDLFNSFKEALKGPITKFTLNNETGYLNVSSTSMLISLAKGKVENVSKLKMIYKQVTEPFNWQNLLTKFRKGFFTNNEGSASGVDKSQIRVFTTTEIADLKSKGVTFPLVAGRPYIMITNPVQATGQTAIPQFIELERKQLNSETHSFITAPIYNFIDKYNQFKNMFSDLTTNELADLITSSNEFLPILIDKLNTKYSKQFILSNDALELRKEINDLLYSELTEEDKTFKKGMTVKNIVKPFTKKNSKGEIQETNGVIVNLKEEEAEVKIGDEVITVKTTDLQPVLKRKPGPAQKAFNIIAQGNSTAAGYSIRLKYRSGSTVLSKAKSLLPRTEDLTVEQIVEKFKAMSSFKQQEVLNKFIEIYGKPVDINSEEDIININKLVSKTMSYEQLNEIFGKDSNDNISNLRVPVKIETTFDDAGQAIRLAYNENYVPTQYDALFFEDKLESVQATSAAVTVDDLVKPNNVKPNTPPKPTRTRLKFLLKSVGKELGKKLDTKNILTYLKSIDKTLTADEVRFVTAAELMILSGGKQTWGFFKDGIIYLEQDEFGKAYENVARHELFHRIFDMMLTESQKRLVYQKAIEEFNLPQDIELDAIEELLAEKYQEWRNNNKFSSFFTTLFNRIKRWLGMSVNIAPSIDSLFEMIENSYFSEQVDVGDTNKGYNDILKDFDSILNFKNSKLYIISYLHDLSNNEKNEEYLEEYSTQTSIEKLESIYNYVVEEYNALKDREDLTEEEKVDLMFLSKLVNRKVYNSLIEDMFQGINLDKVSTEEIISTDWTDDIKDAEEVNQESKISQSVKQLLSTIINTKKVTQVNPRFAFLTVLETFSNINTETEKVFREELAKRFKDFYVKNTDVGAIQNRINDLLDWAYIEDYKGINLNNPFDFVTPNLFKNSEGKYLSRRPNETNASFFKRIQGGTEVDLKLLNLLYLRADARNNINELYAQAGSLYAQNVMYGEFAGFGKDYRQTFKNAIVEAEIRTERDNLADLFIQRAAGLESNISKEATKAAALKNSDEKKQKAISLFRQMFLYQPKNVQDSNVNDLLKKMSDLYEYYKTFTGENAQEDFQDRLLSDYSGLLSSIAKEHMVSAETDVRNPNYRRTDGKTAYKFTLSSFAINTVQSIINGVNLPTYLKTNFYKNYNIFLNGISKIHNYVNFDGIVDENRETDAVRYKSENEADWFRRNFNYFFLAFDNDAIKNKNTYLQQFVTISNKPNIIAAEVDILDWNKIEKSVISILDQQSSRNFTGVKVKNSLNVFEPLVARKENETNNQYAKRIMETFKSKEGLTELLNTESKIDSRKLENMAKKFANEDINELSKIFYANFFVNLHQLNQIVSGDEAFYKNSFDVVKRMSIAFATGYKGMVNNKFGLPKYYKSLVLKDIKGILGDDYAKYKEIVGKSFDLTDAQGFMTSKRAEQLRRAYGTAFNFGSVIKPVHFEVDENGVPRAVKYSCVELTPELCAMFPILDKVRQALEDNKIDELVFESAVKVGKPSNIQETLKDGSIDTVDPNSVITLQNSNYRIQGNPEHDVDGQDVAFPTQLGYFFNFSGLNTALAEKLFKAQEFLINNGLGNVIKELGIGAKLLEGESLEQNQNKQRDNVRKRLIDNQAEERDQRQNEFYANPKLGINTPFLVKKAITTMASMFKKATVAIKLPGAGLVLQSAYGTAIFKDAQGNEVERPLKWRDSEGYAEVVLPDFWQGKFQIGDSILFDTMVGFRIPATELHSAVPLKVVGFYPNNKNVVIAPPEIVFFHGSDYDVDKLYVMRREVYDKEIYSISGKVINDPKIPVGYSDNKFNEKYADVLKTELLIVQEQINSAKNLEDADALKGLKTRLYDLKQLQDVYYKNFIVDLFVQVTTAKVNENLMMAPISMERFKGVGIDSEQSAFDLVAELKGFKEPKPKFKDFTTLESYENAVEEWKDKRDAVIYTKRNLYDLNDQMLMHKDNFSGTKLTGSFANMAKVIAYFFQSTSDNAYPKLKESYHITLNGKTYEGFDYYENTKEVLVAYDSEGNPVYKKPSITETIDSLINAAIDNVKEQILPVIGFTNNTGGAAVSMISMGIPLNEVVMTMLQPAVNTINRFTSYSIGYSAALTDLKEAYATRLKAESFSALTEDQQKAFDENLPEVTVKDMKAMFGKEISQLSEKEIKLQLAVLKNIVNKANNTSDYITTASTAYSVLKEFPVDFPGMENVLEAFDKMWTEGTVVDPETGKEVSVNEASETFPFTNVVPHKLPHINAAFKTLKTLKSKVEHLFFAHYKTLQGFSNTILPKYGLGVRKASKSKEVTAKIREKFLQYFMSGLSFTTPEGYTINLDTSKESVYTDARGKEYSGMDAWLRKFADQIREAKKANPENKFLRKLSLGKKFRVNFDAGKNLTQEDFIDLQLEFDKLKVDGKFTEFQYELVKYSIIQQGLSFGSNNYSLVLPSAIYEPFMEKYNEEMNKYTSNSELYNEFLNQIGENFVLQYSMNNAKEVVRNIKPEDTKEGPDRSILVSKENPVTGENPPAFVRSYSTLYTLLPLNPKYPNDYVYARVGDFNQISGYQFNTDIIGKQYNLQEVFNIDIPTIPVTNNRPKNGIFESLKDYSVGQKIRLVNYSDYTRMNLIEYTVSEKTTKGSINTYVLTDSQEVSEIVTDDQIVNSNEYKKLIEEGYTGEVALHKIKNKC